MAEFTFGKFLMKRELGRGAMGVVWEASDSERGCDVALKVMNVPTAATPESLQRQRDRFDREARALSLLCHPNIVRFYEQGELNGRHYFSMERISGTNLRDRLQFQGPLSLPELKRLSLELLGALDHAHAQGVIHRDLKPDNIMFTPDGSGKLMDFGIARILSEPDPSAPGGFQGSPAYMSPEQVAGGAVDTRTDIYSLGITLYEAAANRRAFDGDSILAITQKVVREYPVPPPGLPPYFQAAMMKAISKDPEDRYARAGEMAEDIHRARMPQLRMPPPPPPLPVYVPPPPVYLGGAEPPAPAKPPSPWILPPISAAPTGRTVCRVHGSMAAVETCGQCGAAVCYTCLVEVTGRGVLCRSCAFGLR